MEGAMDYETPEIRDFGQIGEHTFGRNPSGTPVKDTRLDCALDKFGFESCSP
jgi:hypothetical protein